MNASKSDQIDREIMSEQVTEKVWHIPAHGDSGPVTMTLRMPDVTITDSDGRFIVISPEQSVIVSSRLEDINIWLQHGEKGGE